MPLARDLMSTCGQLMVGGFVDALPPRSFLQALSRQHRAGAVLFRRNTSSVEQAHQACRMLLDAAPQQLPPLIGVDQEGGRVARLGPPVLQLPPMDRMGRVRDATLLRRVAHELGQQLRSIGFNLDFAPVLDIHTNPANPVIGDRAFSSDPTVVAELGVAVVQGLQNAGIMACGKHFPGHGDTSSDSHFGLPLVRTKPKLMRFRELSSFRAAIQANVAAIMTAHVVYDGLDPHAPATLSGAIVTQLLRGELAFEGLVISDDLEMGAIAACGSIQNAAVLAVAAGCDLLLVCKDEGLQTEALEALVHAAERDTSFRHRCEVAARRSIQARITHPPAPAPTASDVLALVHRPEARLVSDALTSALGHAS